MERGGELSLAPGELSAERAGDDNGTDKAEYRSATKPWRSRTALTEV
jgi:hypothetical protein